MAHRTRVQVNKFPCNHKGLGKYCHFCKDLAAGRPVGVKKKKTTDASADASADPNAANQPPKTWKRAKCPYCGGNRVKKNELNVFSDANAYEYRCTSYNCGKQFNSEQVKEYEEVEAKVNKGPVERWNRLTD